MLVAHTCGFSKQNGRFNDGTADLLFLPAGRPAGLPACRLAGLPACRPAGLPACGRTAGGRPADGRRTAGGGRRRAAGGRRPAAGRRAAQPNSPRSYDGLATIKYKVPYIYIYIYILFVPVVPCSRRPVSNSNNPLYLIPLIRNVITANSAIPPKQTRCCDKHRCSRGFWTASPFLAYATVGGQRVAHTPLATERLTNVTRTPDNCRADAGQKCRAKARLPLIN